MEDIKILINDEREDEAYPGYARKIPVNVIYKYTKSICKLTIEENQISGTGFFMCLYDNQKKRKCLITNFHVISQDLVDLKKNILIQLENKKERKIKLDSDKRFIRCFDKPKDITIVEIIDIDGIINQDILFLSYDLNYISGYEQYHNADIFILQHPLGKDSEFAPGKITEIEEFEFRHSAETDHGSSGSPVILYGNYEDLKVIGIHKEYDKNDKHGIGTFIGEIGEFFIKEIQIKKKIKSDDIIDLKNERIEQNLYINNKIKYNKKHKEYELEKCSDNSDDILKSEINEDEDEDEDKDKYSKYKILFKPQERKITLISYQQAELSNLQYEREKKICNINSK